MQIFTHGETPEKDRELFARIGELALSKAVQDDLGVCPTSEPGRIWFVLDGQKGFVSLQMLKNGTAHMRHLWATQLAGRKKLIKNAIKKARQHGAKAVRAVEKTGKAAKTLISLGFAEIDIRGQYSTLEYTYESEKPEK